MDSPRSVQSHERTRNRAPATRAHSHLHPQGAQHLGEGGTTRPPRSTTTSRPAIPCTSRAREKTMTDTATPADAPANQPVRAANDFWENVARVREGLRRVLAGLSESVTRTEQDAPT